MTRETVLARGRHAAEPGFVDRCVLAHPTGTTTDDLTGAVVKTYATYYDGDTPGAGGRCRFQAPSGSPAESGEAIVGILGMQLQVPVLETVGVEVHDRVMCVASLNDPDMVGRVWYVQSLFDKSHATTRRLALTGEAT